MQQRFFPKKIEETEREDATLEPAFYTQSLPYVNYADSLSAMTSGNGIQKIDQAEFASRIGFTWTESILIPAQYRDELWREKTSPHFAATEIEYRLHHPLDNLVICSMQDKTDQAERSLGYGVFLAPHAQPILSGTAIGIYAGVMEELPSGIANGYEMSSSHAEAAASILVQKYNRPGVNALPSGNIMRFLQDLPDENELEDRDEDPLALSNIMTCNVMVWPALYYGIPVPFLLSSRTIYPGEQLGYPYEGHYWLHKQRCLFNKESEVIGYILSDKKIEFKKGFVPSEEQRVEKIDRKNFRLQLQDLLVKPSIDTFDYQKRFFANVNAALNIFLNRYRDEEEISQFLKKVQISFNENQSSDEAYTKLFIFNSIKSSSPLINLKKELFFHMTKYNEGKKLSSKKEPTLADQTKMRMGGFCGF